MLAASLDQFPIVVFHIGLAIAAHSALYEVDQEMAELIHNITLMSVLVFALLGPVLVKIAFGKAGEIPAK